MRFTALAALCVVPGSMLLAQAPRSMAAGARGLEPLTAEARRGLETITASDVKRRVEIIADDSMGGRDTPSRGLEATARYIASEFERLGLTPGGDGGSFVQRYPIPGSRQGQTPRTAPNVVGMLEGSDPVLKNEYVVLSAHMDHVGIGAPVNGDSIYNGADDDASGTAAVLELAEALTRPGARPKRSVLFLTVSGEEHGLWGSAWFSERPAVPVSHIVADLNIDMIGRNWKDTIVVIGKEHSDLGTTLNRVNRAHPELGMNAIDDLWPDENFYFRSDHYNFARKGVPVLFFFNGTHPDYHGPDDEANRIDAEKEARIVRLVYLIAQEVGNSAQKPVWNPASYKKIVRP
ncbi:MAG TPA: M28 family metallopeptidase [Gemmatimonadaceae bacterium]|nr:M28 family metallopeptidase [Gemmatimonadaceae bacterium]